MILNLICQHIVNTSTHHRAVLSVCHKVSLHNADAGFCILKTLHIFYIGFCVMKDFINELIHTTSDTMHVFLCMAKIFTGGNKLYTFVLVLLIISDSTKLWRCLSLDAVHS